MSDEHEQRDRDRSPASALRGSRLMLACALALVAALLVMAARMERAEPVDPTERIGRRMELTELIIQEQERNDQLEQQLEQLAAEIAEYEAAAVAGSDELAELQAGVDQVEVHSGLTAVRGPGLVVTMTDSALEYDGEGDPNNFVVHEEDLRAVVNALWAGGAEAISINDSRVLATSSIQCVGNTLRLNGRLYAPPFEVRAIGDPADLAAELGRDPIVQQFRRHAEEFQLGYQTSQSEELEAPAAPGTMGLELAQPAAQDG